MDAFILTPLFDAQTQDKAEGKLIESGCLVHGFWHAILFEVMLGLIMLELFLVLIELREARR